MVSKKKDSSSVGDDLIVYIFFGSGVVAFVAVMILPIGNLFLALLVMIFIWVGLYFLINYIIRSKT